MKFSTHNVMTCPLASIMSYVQSFNLQTFTLPKLCGLLFESVLVWPLVELFILYWFCVTNLRFIHLNSWLGYNYELLRTSSDRVALCKLGFYTPNWAQSPICCIFFSKKSAFLCKCFKFTLDSKWTQKKSVLKNLAMLSTDRENLSKTDQPNYFRVV